MILLAIWSATMLTTCFGQGLSPGVQTVRSRPCAGLCVCSWNLTVDVKLIIQCQKMNLSFIPSGLDAEANVLKLESNIIATLRTADFWEVPGTRIIRVDYNNISSIQDDAFVNLNRLIYLSLAGNSLRSVNDTTFKHLSSLSGLSLSANPLQYISRNAFSFLPNLAQLFLLKTSLICGCEQLFLGMQLLVYNVTISGGLCLTKVMPVIGSDLKTLNDSSLGTSTACNDSGAFGAQNCSVMRSNTSLIQPDVETCLLNENACSTTITIARGTRSRVDRCISMDDCRVLLQQSVSSCNENDTESVCNYCCANGPVCNANLYSWSSRRDLVIPIYCPPNVTNLSIGSVAWPSTLVGRSAQVACPVNISFVANLTQVPVATRQCLCSPDGSVRWDVPEYAACEINDGNVVTVLSQLINLTNSQLAESISVITDGVTRLKNMTTEVASLFLAVLNRVYEKDVQYITAAEQSSSSASSILTSLTSLANSLVLTNDTQVIRTSNLVIAAMPINVSNFSGLEFNLDFWHDTNVSSQVTNELVNESAAQISISPSQLKNIVDSTKNTITRINFVVQTKDTIFKAVQLSKQTNTSQLVYPASGDGLPTSSSPPAAVGSWIVDISIPNVTVARMTDLVQIELLHVLTANRSYSCAYWDGATATWSDTGVTTMNNGSRTTCGTSHFTNFALLMDVGGDPIKPEFQEILSWMSLVGCAISLVGILITLVTTLKRRGLKHEIPGKILVNLCFALGFTNLIFLILTNFTRGAICQITAVTLHFFVLSSFMWMLIEAFYMYLSLILVFGTHYSRFMLKMAAIGWGVPLLIVVITISIDVDNYGNNQGLCFLKENARYGAFFAPAALILVINTVVFGLVLHRLFTTNSSLRKDKVHRLDVSKQLRATVSVAVLLGLTWFIGFLAIGEAKEAMMVLFVIFNSLQGFFVFLFYCALRPEIQHLWWPVFCHCLKPMQEKIVSSGTLGDTTITTIHKLVKKSTATDTVTIRLSGSYSENASFDVVDTAPVAMPASAL